MKNHPVRLVVLAALLSSAATILALRWDILPDYTHKESAPPAFAAASPAGQAVLSNDEETNVMVYSQVSPGSSTS